MDSLRLSGLKDMETPATAVELTQFIYCCRWMAISLSQSAQRSSLLNEVLEEPYSQTGKRTKGSIKNI